MFYFFSFKEELNSHQKRRENANSRDSSPHVAPRTAGLAVGCAAPWAFLLHWGTSSAGSCPHRSRRKPSSSHPSLTWACPRMSLWKRQPTHAGLLFPGEGGAGCPCEGQSAGLSHPAAATAGRGRSPRVGAALLKHLPCRGCWVPCVAVEANALALPGCSLTSFFLGYCCGWNCLP